MVAEASEGVVSTEEADSEVTTADMAGITAGITDMVASEGRREASDAALMAVWEDRRAWGAALPAADRGWVTAPQHTPAPLTASGMDSVV